VLHKYDERFYINPLIYVIHQRGSPLCRWLVDNCLRKQVTRRLGSGLTIKPVQLCKTHSKNSTPCLGCRWQLSLQRSAGLALVRVDWGNTP
jgi:hypothetical protein